MLNCLNIPLLLLLAFVSSSLFAQIDPNLIDSLSKLPVEQRLRLIKQNENQQPHSNSDKSNSSNLVPSTESNLEEMKSYNSLDDLIEFETMISEDIEQLEEELNDPSFNNQIREDAINELRKYKDLLRKLKSLQRFEIEKRTDQLEKGSKTKSLKPFGHDLFFESDREPLMIDAPIPAEYRIGPGDLIEIQLFGQRNQSYSLEISREGTIRFPEIGPVNVFEAGTSFVALKNLLKQKIKEQLGAGVQSSITLGALRTINIFLLGEVEKQGVLTVNSMASVIDAILGSSGIKESGSMRAIQLKRAGKLIAKIDLYDLLLRGDSSTDHLLEPGDVVFVPVIKNQISVDGAVRRPAKYELVGGENLAEIIELSGGLDFRAFATVVNLERLDENFYPLIKSLNLIRDAEFKIKSGDFLTFNYAVSNVRNTVSLIGAVEKEGDYEWKLDLQLKDLITDRLDFSYEIDLEYGLIVRKAENGKILCLSFVPSEIFEGAIIPLLPEDDVYFFSKSSRDKQFNSIIKDLRSQATSGEFAKLVRVTGSVHFPGEYPLTESMSLLDLIRACGGTKDSAYMVDAEITRMVIDSEQEASLRHIRVDQQTLIDLNKSSAFKLKPYDVLSIKPIPLWREGESIQLTGEFRFPGSYSIKNGETLIDVIIRAGGLSERAFPQGAIFSRQNLRVKEDEQKQRLISQLEADLATATLSSTDSKEMAQAQSAANAMLSRLRNTVSQGRLVINLKKLLDSKESTGLLVKSGDALFVPQIPYSVSVSGEVQFPTSHLHEDDLDLDDYLKRSGGFTQNADKDRTFVVKANGAVMTKGGNAWFGKGNSTNRIQAGDVIVVPIDVKQTRFLENLTYGTQIIYQLAVAAAAVNSF